MSISKRWRSCCQLGQTFEVLRNFFHLIELTLTSGFNRTAQSFLIFILDFCEVLKLYK